MIQNKINNLVSTAIFLLYNKILSGHKKVKMVLGKIFQNKAKSKRCDSAMQKNGSRKALLLKERVSILEHVHCNMGIFETSCN